MQEKKGSVTKPAFAPVQDYVEPRGKMEESDKGQVLTLDCKEKVWLILMFSYFIKVQCNMIAHHIEHHHCSHGSY